MNITNMLKKGHEIKWIAEARRYFKEIEQAILEAPVLVSPYFTKYFLVFSYASEHTIVVVCYRKIMRTWSNP